MIDAHVHFNKPGRTDWEGFATGSAALAAGGGTCFCEMPLNASPPTLDGESFDAKRRAAEASSHTDFSFWGGLTPINLDKLAELSDRGVMGFKAFMTESGIDDFPYADDATLEQGMQTAARLGLPVAVHAEDQGITSRLTAQVGARNCPTCAIISLRGRSPPRWPPWIARSIWLAEQIVRSILCMSAPWRRVAKSCWPKQSQMSRAKHAHITWS